jgi:hypothetical protein
MRTVGRNARNWVHNSAVIVFEHYQDRTAAGSEVVREEVFRWFERMNELYIPPYDTAPSSTSSAVPGHPTP